MTKQTNPIIDKIKALLAKAASSEFEAEAAAFASKAHELMEQHQIGALDLETDDPLGVDDTITGSTSESYKRVLYVQLAHYYGCQVVRRMISKNKFILQTVGRESARVTATLMYPFIMDQVKKAARALHEKTAHLGGVTVGMMERRVANALAIRLKQLSDAARPAAGTAAGKNALMTMDAVKEFMEQNFKNLSQARKATVHTCALSKQAAAEISLNHQAAAPANAKKLGGR